MFLQRWLRRAQSEVFGRRVRRTRLPLGKNEFRIAAVHERARADRSRLPVAVLVFEHAPNRSRRDVALLSEVLHQRLRMSDTVGFLEDGRLAVLLPATPVAAAWKVAGDVCNCYSAGNGCLHCEVCVYPDEDRPSHGTMGLSGDEYLSGRGVPLESLMAQQPYATDSPRCGEFTL